MIAPSPDWFAGIYDYSPIADGDWHQTFTIESYPYDSGTDDGTTYNSANIATNPQGTIIEITAATSPPSSQVFVKDGDVLPVLKWTFTRNEDAVVDDDGLLSKVKPTPKTTSNTTTKIVTDLSNKM